MRFKVVDVETGALLPHGAEGEVVVAGPNVMAGYLNNPAATAAAFDADGWFKTGDVGFVDADGYITFTDRLKELIKYNGFQASAAATASPLLLSAPALCACSPRLPLATPRAACSSSERPSNQPRATLGAGQAEGRA